MGCDAKGRESGSDAKPASVDCGLADTDARELVGQADAEHPARAPPPRVSDVARIQVLK